MNADSSATYDSSGSSEFTFSSGATGQVMQSPQALKVRTGNVNIRLPFTATDTAGQPSITFTQYDDVMLGDEENYDINVILTVGGNTDIVLNRKRESNNDSVCYSYGDTSYKFNSRDGNYQGSDGKTYIRLFNSPNGAADTYISTDDGTVTTVVP